VFQDPMLKSLIGTTLAIDLINGGVKTNALPERAWAVVNHRIATERSI
jgi:Gly-Xaa carboxypeptidase